MKNLSEIKATVENLKANREIVIEFLTEYFGKEELKSKMICLLNQVELAENFEKWKTLENCIDDLVELSQTSRRKTTKKAEILGALAQLEEERK